VAVGPIQRHKRATGSNGLLEESSKCCLLIAITFWMLLPDERIRRDPEQRFEVVHSEWAQLEEFSKEKRLSIK
jgi:hypothetical protein